jgi:hypothetical protein
MSKTAQCVVPKPPLTQLFAGLFLCPSFHSVVLTFCSIEERTIVQGWEACLLNASIGYSYSDYDLGVENYGDTI